MKNYSTSEALLIKDVLIYIKEGAFENEHYIGYRVVKPDNASLFLILTEEHLFLIEANSKDLMWHIKCNSISSTANIENGIIIHLKEETEMGIRYVLLPV
jgi:hypothetical protein